MEGFTEHEMLSPGHDSASCCGDSGEQRTASDGVVKSHAFLLTEDGAGASEL